LGQLESQNNIFKLYSPMGMKVKGINQEIFEDYTIINQNSDSVWILEFLAKD